MCITVRIDNTGTVGGGVECVLRRSRWYKMYCQWKIRMPVFLPGAGQMEHHDDVLCSGQRKGFARITNKVTQNNDKEEL
jgi:hypothetical protein